MVALSLATASKQYFRPTKPATSLISCSRPLKGHIGHLQTPIKLYPQQQQSLFPSTQRANRSFAIGAIDPRKQDQQNDSNLTAFTSQEDLDYLWKLLAGSVIGGALIKYGSAVFPEITKPSLTLALLIILSPVLVSILLLINQSSKHKKPK